MKIYRYLYRIILHFTSLCRRPFANLHRRGQRTAAHKQQNLSRSLNKRTYDICEIDEQLSQWLTKHGIDEFSQTIILNEGFTYEDFLFNTEKLDLMRLELRLVLQKFNHHLF